MLLSVSHGFVLMLISVRTVRGSWPQSGCCQVQAPPPTGTAGSWAAWTGAAGSWAAWSGIAGSGGTWLLK